MYKIIKDVINAKGYNLTDITSKIEKRCFEGKITEEERDELLTLANQNANPEKEKASEQKQLDAVFQNLAEMALEIKALKTELAELKGEEAEGEIVEEYPQWERWNGIDRSPWQEGSKCIHNGVKYISQVNDNIWEPGAPGVDERIWKVVETE